MIEEARPDKRWYVLQDYVTQFDFRTELAETKAQAQAILASGKVVPIEEP